MKKDNIINLNIIKLDACFTWGGYVEMKVD